MIASKTKLTKMTDGTFIRGCGLYTSMLLETAPQIKLEDFHYKLQKLIEHAKLEFDVLQACNAVLNKLTNQINFYAKFTKIWDSLGIKDKGLDTADAQKVRECAWMIFIVAKVKLFSASHRDITEIAILLFAVLNKVVQHIPKEVNCDILKSVGSND